MPLNEKDTLLILSALFGLTSRSEPGGTIFQGCLSGHLLQQKLLLSLVLMAATYTEGTVISSVLRLRPMPMLKRFVPTLVVSFPFSGVKVT